MMRASRREQVEFGKLQIRQESSLVHLEGGGRAHGIIKEHLHRSIAIPVIADLQRTLSVGHRWEVASHSSEKMGHGMHAPVT